MEWNINEPDQFFENKEGVKTEQEESNVIADPPALEDGVKPEPEQNAVNAETIKYEASEMLADTADHNEYIDMAVVTFVKLENTEHEMEGKYMYTNILQITNEGSMMDDFEKEEPLFVDTAYTESTAHGECSTATPGDNIHGSSTSSTCTREQIEVFDHVQRSGEYSVPSYNYFIEADKKLTARPEVKIRLDPDLDLHLRNSHGPLTDSPLTTFYVCSICDKKFSTNGELNQHQEHNDCLKAASLKCTICLKELTTENGLAEHKKSHTNETPKEVIRETSTGQTQNVDNRTHKISYPCLVCSMTFRRQYKLQHHHSALHYTEHPNMCVTCGENLPSPAELVRHRDTHIYRYTCDVCGKVLASQNLLNAHLHKNSVCMVRKKISIVMMNLPYKCQFCAKAFEHLLSLQRHHRAQHRKKHPTTCYLCGEVLPSASELEKHKAAIHSQEKPYKCHVCGKGLANHMNLQWHLRGHAGKLPCLCEVCGSRHKSPAELFRHMQCHSEDKKHICSICSKKFPFAAGLTRHMATHSSEKPYKCEECGKGFRDRQGLNRHKLTHIPKERKKSLDCSVCNRSFSSHILLKVHQDSEHKERTYTCSLCGKGLLTQNSLKSHLHLHKGKRRYSCKNCYKRFTTAEAVKTHMVCHSEEKPYLCDVCAKGFRLPHQLATHQLSHTGERPHKCDVCGTGFVLPHHLRAHILTHKDKKGKR